MTLVFLGFSLVVLILVTLKGVWAYVFLIAVFVNVFIFGGLRKVGIIVILTIMAFLSIFWHQQKIIKFEINNSLFSGKIIDKEVGGKYLVDVNFNRILIHDNQDMIPTYYRGEFLGGGYFKKSFPGGVLLFDFGNEDDRYARWLFMKGLGGVVYLNSFLPIESFSPRKTPVLKTFLNGIKKNLSQKINTLYSSPYRGILKAILLGIREDLGDRQYRQLIDTGIVHIVVISGAHLGLIASILTILLIWVPFYLRLILIFLGTSFYMLLVGMDPSVLRAWLLMSIYLLSFALGREFLIWRMLGLAWIVMLIYNPRFLAYDIGFVLSFAAVGGITIVFQFIKEFVKNTYLQKLIGSILIPIGAFLGILPILLFFIGEINLLSWLLNILILPLLPFIIIGTLFSLIVPGVAFVVRGGIDILLAINHRGLKRGIWLQAAQNSWRTMGLLLLSILWLYSAYLFFWKFLPYHRYEKLYNGSQGHKSVTDQIKL